MPSHVYPLRLEAGDVVYVAPDEDLRTFTLQSHSVDYCTALEVVYSQTIQDSMDCVEVRLPNGNRRGFYAKRFRLGPPSTINAISRAVIRELQSCP